MSITDSAFLLSVAIIIGLVIQQTLIRLKQHNKKIGYTILRLVALAYWGTLGIVLISGAMQSGSGDSLPNISGVALGLGLMLSGLAQTLERSWIRTLSVLILPIGPVVSGVGFIQSGNALGGMIALVLGLGILVSALKGWLSGVGQMTIGATLIGSSTMLLISLLVINTMQSDFANVAIGVVMLLLGLWTVVSGAVTVMGSIRQSAQSTPPSVS